MEKKIKIGAIFALSLILLVATTNLLVVDTSADNIIDYYPEENDTVSGTTLFWVNDTGNGDRCELYIDGELVTYMTETGTSPDWQYSLNTANWDDGRHLVQYKSIGGSGDELVGVTVFFDNSEPAIEDVTVHYPGLQSAARYGDEIYFTAQVTDPYSEISTVSIDVSSVNSTYGVDNMYDDGLHDDGSIDDGIYGSIKMIVDETSGTGVYYVEIEATDGYNPVSQGVYVKVDETMPSINEIQLISSDGRERFKKGDEVRVIAQAEDFSNPSLPGGVHQVYADCSELGGPSYIPMYDDGEHGDYMSGDSYYGSDSFVVNYGGTYFLTSDVHCMDIGGNTFTSQKSVGVDNAPPRLGGITVEYPDDRGYVMDGEEINIKISGYDDAKKLYLDATSIGSGSSLPNETGGAEWVWLSVNTGYQSGMFKCTITGTDEALNEGRADVYVQVINPTLDVEILNPADGITGISGPLNIQADVFNNSVDISDVYLYIDHDKIGTLDFDDLSGYWEYDLLTSTYEDGYHTIGIEAIDINGEVVLNSVRVEFQNEPHTNVKCEIVDPLQDFVLAGIYDIKVSSADPDEINGVVFTIEDLDTLTTTVFENVSMGYSYDTGYWEYTLDTTILGDGNYSLSVLATNNHGFDKADSVTFHIGSQDGRAVKTEIKMGSRGTSSWYFVSSPVEPLNKDLESILNDKEGGIKSCYDKVMAFESSSGKWRSYSPNRADHFNDLNTWDQKMGLWIHMITSADLKITGKINSLSEITLKPGWNMVGYPSNDEINAYDSLPNEISKIGVFDSREEYNIRYVTDLKSIQLLPYNGYWIYNSANYEVGWSVEY